jgi:hypothetical protein
MEQGLFQKTIEASTDFGNGLARSSQQLVQFSVSSVPLW